jgi:hypothetical protein
VSAFKFYRKHQRAHFLFLPVTGRVGLMAAGYPALALLFRLAMVRLLADRPLTCEGPARG